MLMTFYICSRSVQADVGVVKKTESDQVPDKQNKEVSEFDRALTKVSGKWVAFDGSIEMQIENGAASFKIVGQSSVFKELKGVAKKIRHTFVLEFKEDDEYRYSLYWLLGSPNSLTLVRREWATNNYATMEFVKK